MDPNGGQITCIDTSTGLRVGAAVMVTGRDADGLRELSRRMGMLDVYVLVVDGSISGASRRSRSRGMMNGRASWQPIPDFPLVDARFSTFKNDIEWVYDGGDHGRLFDRALLPRCHRHTRSRWRPSSVRALDLPATVNRLLHGRRRRQSTRASINRVRASQHHAGCTATTYCPTAVVTREQMATFLAKGIRRCRRPTTDYFTDDEASPTRSASTASGRPESRPAARRQHIARRPT